MKYKYNIDVYKFLKSIGLTKHIDVFLNNGFEDMETIMELNK